MWGWGVAMNNDIEMVLQVFVGNKMQFYFDFLSTPGTKSVVVRCPQEFEAIH